MISKYATEDFLARRLSNSRKVKRFTRKALSRKLRLLGHSVKPIVKCYKHQLACLLLGLKYPQYLFLLEMGLGKSKLSLDLFRMRSAAGQVKRMLVLVPYSSNIDAWAEQGQTHAPEMKMKGLVGTKEERRAVLSSKADIVVSTYAGLMSFTTIKKKVKKKNKLYPDPIKCKEVFKQFDMIVCDETTSFRNHNSLTCKILRQGMKYIHYRYGLTGSPFGRNAQHLWSQFFVIDGGQTLGKTLSIFRSAFFSKKENYWSGGDDWTFKKKKSAELGRMLAHRSIRYEEAECLDVPQRIYIPRPVIFSETVWDQYDKLREKSKAARGNYEQLKNVFMRMRQIASGFMVVKNPKDPKDRIEIPFAVNPKMDALEDIINEIPTNRKVVIFHEFKMSGKMISDRLTKMGLKHVRLYSGTKDKTESQRAFKHDKDCRFMVSSSAGAYGNNWQNANYVLFYESPVDPLTRMQEEKRVHRGGQTKKVRVFDLYVKNSIEEKILGYIKEGKDLLRAVLKGKASLS